MLPPVVLDPPVAIPVAPTSAIGFAAPYQSSGRKVDLFGSFGSYFIADNLNHQSLDPATGRMVIRSEHLQQGQPTADDRADRTVERFCSVSYHRPRHVRNLPFRPFERLVIEVELTIQQFTHHIAVDNDLLNRGSGFLNLLAEFQVVLPGGERLKRKLAGYTAQARAEMASYQNVIAAGTTVAFTLVSAQPYPVGDPIPVELGVYLTHQARANRLVMTSIVEFQATLSSVRVSTRRVQLR
ncbi:MAG: hypothetical protein MUE52_07090 [Tabrizicola sp.]|nr:hypothetical protein [Tabrizicola sp.]